MSNSLFGGTSIDLLEAGYLIACAKWLNVKYVVIRRLFAVLEKPSWRGVITKM